MARVDYTDRAGAYRAARTLPAEVLASWGEAVTSVSASSDDDRPITRVLDLGAGPGGFLDPLAGWFGAPVVALEPSPAMRAEAAATGLTARYAYVAGRAEQIPLTSSTVDLAWLSTVVHQFDDLHAAAAELRRVVRPAGRVLIRGFFSDLRFEGLFGYFPGIERSAATFPATHAVTAPFGRAGFAVEQMIDVTERWTFGLERWVEGVRAIRHTDSALRPLTDDEFDAGVAAVLAAHADADGPIRSDTVLRLVVLGEPS